MVPFSPCRCVCVLCVRSVVCTAPNTELSTPLRLPMPQMSNFSAYAVDDPNHVFVYEVFIVLALFCDGLLDEKVEFMFKIFDLDSKGYMTEVRRATFPP